MNAPWRRCESIFGLKEARGDASALKKSAASALLRFLSIECARQRQVGSGAAKNARPVIDIVCALRTDGDLVLDRLHAVHVACNALGSGALGRVLREA